LHWKLSRNIKVLSKINTFYNNYLGARLQSCGCNEEGNAFNRKVELNIKTKQMAESVGEDFK